MCEKWLDADWLSELAREKCYGVAVSGGADSVALLRALKIAGFLRLRVLHVNHLLRGEESERDEQFVRNLAEEWHCEISVLRINAAQVSEERRISLETAGREIRQEYFAKEAACEKLEEIFLAHHADDVAETLLWNLLRGSHGWRGIQERQWMRVGAHGYWIRRPLLAVRKAELRDFLMRLGQAWRDDASNAEAFCVRNRIRNEVLPLLGEIAQRDISKNLLKNASLDEAWRETEAWAVARVLDLEQEKMRLSLANVRDLPESLKRAVLLTFFRNNGVPDLTRGHLQRAMAVLAGEKTAESLPGNFVFRQRGMRGFFLNQVKNLARGDEE